MNLKLQAKKLALTIYDIYAYCKLNHEQFQKFADVLHRAVKSGWMDDADVKEFWMLS